MADELDIEIPERELQALLAPWIIREYPRESKAWQDIRAARTRRFRRKWISRAVTSRLIPWIKRRESHRTPEFVRDAYSRNWAGYTWPEPVKDPDSVQTAFLEWNGSGYITPLFARGRCHLLGIAKVLEQLRPSSVLEVGAGPGINLFALCSVFPEIDFSAVELTSAGVEAARSIQRDPLPESIEQIAPMPVKSRTAHQRISFRQGDARNLPFPDQSFDVVFSRLAIEQMEQIREPALAEIHRVARSHTVFVEPFTDFNRDPLQSLATRAKNYISLGVADLRRHGFEPIFEFADWPQKITNGAGMVVCRKI